MNEKGFFMLPQIIALTLLLLAASIIFGTFRLYSKAQAAEDAHLTAVFLAQKEISIAEGQLRSRKKLYSPGIVNETSVEKNGFSFRIKTIINSSGEFKTISATVSWQISSKPAELTMSKKLYENE